MTIVTAHQRVPFREPPIAQFFLADTRLAGFWLIIRVYTGYAWLMAGLEKLGNPAWTGSPAGTGLAGFVGGALQKSTGTSPSVSGWYATFLQSIVLPHSAFWGWLITLRELAVGIGLIVGCLTGFAAFFGGLMNANYLLAGTLSTNPLLFIFATWLVLAWRVAGYWGLDRYLLPKLGVPGQPGEIFSHETPQAQPHPVLVLE